MIGGAKSNHGSLWPWKGLGEVKRRRFLLGAGALALTSAAKARAALVWPEQGLMNPCLNGLPDNPQVRDFIATAWQGLDAAKVWDSHTHLIGDGDSHQGAWANPKMDSLASPLQYIQKRFYLNASCVNNTPGNVDSSYIERMRKLVDGMRPGFKMLLFAFDTFHDENGQPDRDHSTFETPDSYAQSIAAAYPACFEWAASIHPYREDCVAALDQAVKGGARAVKWLPAAMGIDPSSPKCDRFYDALSRHDLPLITHAGHERAVHADELQGYGNPLLLRRALDHRVRVVVAHCASEGQGIDLDQGPDGIKMENIELFNRMMREHRYDQHLFGDISALPQINRAQWLRYVLEHKEWHPRLLNGSDYPLPGVMPLFSAGHIADLGLLPVAAVEPLKQIRAHNPLLFDFALKRNLRAGNLSFANSVFETHDFFTRTQEKKT